MRRPRKEPASSSEADGTPRRRNRRQLLALGGATAAAAAVAALGVDGGKKAQAATGDPLILGQNNTAGDPTFLSAHVGVDPGPSLQIENDNGPAVFAHSSKGHGVFATSGDDSPCVEGRKFPGQGGAPIRGVSEGEAQGAEGVSRDNIGVIGQHISDTVEAPGVRGENLGLGPGVEGIHSNPNVAGPGVVGLSQSGTGVSGQSNGTFTPEGGLNAGVTGGNRAPGPDAGPGVHGFSENGFGVFGSTRGGPQAFGVGGVSDSPDGFPLPFGPGTGVHGTSGSGRGVYGISLTNNGVEGLHGMEGPSHNWGAGVWGLNLDLGPGVEGRADGDGPSVLGWKPSWAGGPGAAVEGQSDRPGSPGVLGESKSGDPGVEGRSGSGPGVRGGSDSGIAVEGNSESGTGVRGRSDSAHGVEGHSVNGWGVFGVSQSSTAVNGHSESGGTGVHGDSQSGPGVQGHSQSGPGVEGIAPGNAPAVRAVSSPTGGPEVPDGGLALDVSGKARFSTAGAGEVPAWRRAASVDNPAVTGDSHITVTFTGNPGWARVAWVERQPGSGFIVHLSGRSPRDVPFTYLIVEPGMLWGG